jgi:hypothetical protein
MNQTRLKCSNDAKTDEGRRTLLPSESVAELEKVGGPLGWRFGGMAYPPLRELHHC